VHQHLYEWHTLVEDKMAENKRLPAYNLLIFYKVLTSRVSPFAYFNTLAKLLFAFFRCKE